MRIVVFGTYDFSRHPRALVITEGLRANGSTVLECNLPLGFSTADRVAMLSNPLLLVRLVAALVLTWARLLRRGIVLRRGGGPDVVLVPYLGHFDVHLARAIFPRAVIVLDHLVSASDTAVDRRVSGKLTHWLLRTIDRAAVQAAHVVVVDTDENLALLPLESRSRAVVVPVGAPSAWFLPSPRRRSEEHCTLSVAFFGMFTPLHGADTLGAAVGLLADDQRIRFTLVGSGQDLCQAQEAAAKNPRVTWIPWVPSSRLPQLVASHDICIGILGSGSKATRVVPNKVFQGAAAGCAIVTSATPPQQRELGDAALYVPAGSADELANLLRRLAGDPALLWDHRTRCRRRAESFRGQTVVLPLSARLAAVVDD